MIRLFLRDSALYTLSVVLTRGVSFFLLPLYTAVLTPEAFGTFDYLVAIGNVVAIVVALEVAQGIHRYIPEVVGNLTERRLYASTALIFTCLCYLAFVLVVICFSSHISRILLGNAESGAIIAMASVMFAVNGVLALVQGQLRSELRVADNVKSSIVASLSSTLFSVIALLWLKAGVIGLISAIALGNSVSIIYALNCCRDTYRPIFSVAHLRELLSFSMPLVLSSLGVVAASYIDRFMIKNMMSLGDLGVFGVATRIAMITSLLSIGVRQSLTPLIYNKYKEESTPVEIARLFWMYCGFSVIAVVGISSVAPFLLKLLVPDSYAGAAVLVPFACASALFSTLYIFAPGLAIEKKTGLTSVISLCTAAMSLFFNFALIPILGLLGAAVGTLLATVGGFVLYALAAQRYYYIPFFGCLASSNRKDGEQ